MCKRTKTKHIYHINNELTFKLNELDLIHQLKIFQMRPRSKIQLILNKLGIEGNSLNLTENNYKKPTANMLNREKLAFLLDQNKASTSPPIIPFQH